MTIGRLENHQYSDQDIAIQYLGEMLSQGSLALVLGAGICSGVGLPNWETLVKGCLDAAGLPCTITGTSTNNEIMQAIDRVEAAFSDTSKYLDAVHDALYKTSRINSDMFNHPLLVAIGAMVMGGRRGSVKEILTLNFDNVLEYYLSLYGTVPDVIYKLPSLRKDKDVTIYHPHGYLPNENRTGFSDFLILSEFSYHKRLGASLDVWKELTRDFFRRKLVLFIGLSGDDFELMSILTSLDDELRKERPTGFWLFGKPVDEETFFRRNVIPLTLKFDDYPTFLLKICQHASTL